MASAVGHNDVLQMSANMQQHPSAPVLVRPSLSNRQVSPLRNNLAASPNIATQRTSLHQSTTLAVIEESSDDDESEISVSYASTSTAPTRTSSLSSFPTTIANSEKLGLFDQEEEYEGESDVQYLYYPAAIVPSSSSSASSSSIEPSTPPAVLLVPPRMAQYDDYPEHFSYPALDTLSSPRRPGLQRLNTPPPLYTHTCRTRAKDELDASWQPIIPPHHQHQKQQQPRYPQQVRPKSIEQPLTIEQELRRMMDRELAAVLKHRGIPPPTGSMSAGSSPLSSSSSSLLVPPSRPSRARSRPRANRTPSSSSSSLSSASASTHSLSLGKRASALPIIPSPLRRSSSARSSRSTQSSLSTTSTVTTRAAQSVNASAKTLPNLAAVNTKRSSSAVPLARIIGRLFRPRNSTK